MALAEATPLGGLTVSEMIDALYGDDPDGGPEAADNVVKVMICRLRKKLRDAVIVRQQGCRRFLLCPVGQIPKPQCARDVLTPRQAELYDLIKRRPSIGTAEIAKIAGASQECVNSQIWKANKLLGQFGERIAGRPRHGYRLQKIAAQQAA